MYIVLVAPPGVGKTMVTKLVRKLWLNIPDHFVASSSVTKASLVDELREAARELHRPGETPSVVHYNSLKIASNELGVLLPTYENDFMNVLTDIYDGHGYSERRRTKDIHFDLSAPQINLLAATTPSYLNNVLPEGAWDQGFLSRTLLIYSGLRVLVSPFATSSAPKALWKDLQHDMDIFGTTYGEIVFTPEAAEALTTWHLAGGPPTPDHPKLYSYLTRRTLHLLKLCIVANIVTSTKKEITLDQYSLALSWLIEAEHFMPDIFKAMSTGGDIKAIEETWYFLFKMYSTTSKPIPEARVFRYLQERVPAHNIDRIVDVMIRAGLMKETQVNKIGKCYVPQEKKEL